MAEKGRGLRFAEQQLRRHGWQHGRGLGRAEDGISEAIKVKVKCDKGGVGHKEGEQFSFHWWDHVFNKASSSLQVESDQDGIKVKKTADEEDGRISNKKPRKATLAKDKLYGRFVKSSTLLSGQERPEPTASSSSSSDEDEDRRMDLSSTTRLSDSDLMKACGGRTAHKGARHGVTMSAKLARLERQEAEFMAKYGKKSRAADAAAPPSSQPPPKEELMENRQEVNDGSGAEESETAAQPKRRRKKKKKKGDDVDVVPAEHCEAGGSHKHKKHEKKSKVRETLSAGGAAELHADPVKKKKPKRPVDEHYSDSKEPSQSNHTGLEEAESVVRKRKKCKKDKI